MAINVEIIEATSMGRQPGASRMGNVLEHPLNSIRNVAAAGDETLVAGTTCGKIRNRAGGDSVYVLIQEIGAGTAGASNSQLLAAGGEIDFALPKGADATDYEVDIRAIV